MALEIVIIFGSLDSLDALRNSELAVVSTSASNNGGNRDNVSLSGIFSNLLGSSFHDAKHRFCKQVKELLVSVVLFI